MDKEKKILKILDKAVKSSGGDKIIRQESEFLTLYAINNHLFDAILGSNKNSKDIDLFISNFISLRSKKVVITLKPANYYKDGEDTFLQKAVKNATKVEDFDFFIRMIKYIYYFDAPTVESFITHKGEDNKTIFENISDNFFLKPDIKKILEAIADSSIDSIIDSYD